MFVLQNGEVLEVHPEKAGQKREWNEDGGKKGQRRHDSIHLGGLVVHVQIQQIALDFAGLIEMDVEPRQVVDQIIEKRSIFDSKKQSGLVHCLLDLFQNGGHARLQFQQLFSYEIEGVLVDVFFIEDFAFKRFGHAADIIVDVEMMVGNDVHNCIEDVIDGSFSDVFVVGQKCRKCV